MIDIRIIKKNILSAAYQGKLSRITDSTVKGLDELHASIKKYQSVADSEKLIETPPHWKWSRLGYISNNHGQKTPSDTFSYIDVGTLDNVHQRLAKEENIILVNDAPSRARKIVKYGDVLYSTVRPYLHNICIIDKTFSKEPIASTAFCIMSAKPEVIINKFLFYWLSTPEFDKYANGDSSKGTLYPAISEKDLLAGVIPIPPLEEQVEIVKKLDEAFNALLNLEAAQSAYSSDLEILKSKIIDAGIQGKLTEQLPEDGNAEDLYDDIQEEKEKIYIERKGRKDKKIKPIDEDTPFVIPEHWRWIRLGDVGLFKKGPFGSALTKSMFVSKTDQTIKVYEQQHAIKKDSSLGTYYITREYFDEKMSGFEVLPGDIIVSCAGTIGEIYILPDGIEKGIINQALMRITLPSGINKRFFQYYFDANLKKSAQEESNGSAIKNIPPFDVLKNWYFPLIPYEEQLRIVESIDATLNVVK